MQFTTLFCTLQALSLVYAAACPFHLLRGVDPEAFPPELVAQFKREHPKLFEETEERANTIIPPKLRNKRGLVAGGSLGGGLLNGVLQPFTGVLSGIAIPLPQVPGIKKIPDSAHPFIYPSKDAQRGPCPALNTMANHGYIARSGITTFKESTEAQMIAFGMGYDAAIVLAAVALLSGGDLPSGLYSIGGVDSRVPNTFGPSLGLAHHGPFEVDDSITRQDAYFGNPSTFMLSKWNFFRSLAKSLGLTGGQEFGMKAMVASHAIAYTESRNTNPDFDANIKYAFAGLLARAFVYRLMSNGTRPNYADLANVGPFFLNETFPPNWYRSGTPYTFVNSIVDVMVEYDAAPFELGANQGVGNFVVSPQQFPTTSANDLACFLLVNIFDLAPSFILPNIVTYTAFVNGAILPFFGTSFSCPLTLYTKPGMSANNDGGTRGANGSPINGVYPSK